MDWGEFEIVDEIGRGAMGVVFRARQKGVGRMVALKVLQSGQGATAQDIARFEREAKALGRLRHPGIVGVHGAGVHEGFRYLVLEFVEGPNLEDLIADGPLAIDRAAGLVAAAAAAVGEAHRAGIVHRDLKPANILVDADGRPRVADFGLARLAATDDGQRPASLTATGDLLGTPLYMAPELLFGDARQASPAADVHALGATLFELLTGRVPYPSETVEDLLEQQFRATGPTRPSRLRPGIPPDLDAICLVAMAPDPADRYADGRALAEDLERFSRGEPVEARPAAAALRLLRDRRFRRRAAPILTALLVAAATGGLTLLLTNDRPDETVGPKPAPPADRPAEDAWEVVFEDDFERTLPGPPWRSIRGRWSIEDGRLVGAARGEVIVAWTGAVGGDVAVEFRARMIDRVAPCDLSSFLHGRGEFPHHDGYHFSFGGNWNERCYISRDGAPLIDSLGPTIAPGRWYLLRSERIGDRFALSVDGRQILVADDPFPVTGDAIGFYTYDSRIEIDDVRILRRPALDETRFDVADGLLRIGRFELAETAFETLLAADLDRDDSRRARCGLARSLAGQGEVDSALELLAEAAALDPDGGYGTLAARIEVRAGRGPAAARRLADMLSRAPADAAARTLLLESSHRRWIQGGPEDAIALWRTAWLWPDPDPSRRQWVGRRLGQVLLAEGRTGEALEHLETVGGGPWIDLEIGNAHRAADRTEEALAAYRRSAGDGGDDGRMPVPRLLALCGQGDLLRASDRPDEALAAYHQAIERFGEGPTDQVIHALRSIAEVAAGLDRPDEALAAANALAARFADAPGDASAALLAAGDALGRAGRATEAGTVYRRLAEGYGDQPAAAAARERTR